jgi:hypothetical protein
LDLSNIGWQVGTSDGNNLCIGIIAEACKVTNILNVCEITSSVVANCWKSFNIHNHLWLRFISLNHLKWDWFKEKVLAVLNNGLFSEGNVITDKWFFLI